ncbi:hypothetical protein MARPU_07825 [Marichromatium purpuratum 984]|uniref:Uncharacterized protein n=1 Tax=Marichromatium purpuratum 984 TaxID=765910 RepID=W0E3X7_MARPU|nr:hypothetical protein [Marichromatium purpuratum]AHF03781.1 hypothetical protein MARPU_07825 [Marichromatium purpuratum 984]
MHTKQTQALWELQRQGLPDIAESAARHWSEGRRYEPDEALHIPRSLETLIEQCNWEIERVSAPA